MKRQIVTVRLDPELIATIRERLRDPATGRTRPNAMSSLFEQLLWKWCHDSTLNNVEQHNLTNAKRGDQL